MRPLTVPPLRYVLGALVLAAAAIPERAAEPLPRQLRIIGFGAHPDDVEFRLAGTAAKWIKLGHKVKFVSLTNGDIGHWNAAGGPVAQRRTAEAKETARRIGAEAEVVDNHDGELMPTLENRRIVTRIIREWKADVVLSLRPWDYHPDHRNGGVLVQDAAFMVTVPYFCPDVPALKTNPVFLYFPDKFTKPYPFSPDIAVAIDEVLEAKFHALDALESQIYEGGANGSEQTLVQRAARDPERRRQMFRARLEARDIDWANRSRPSLVKWYGAEQAARIKYAEAFEICEYGRMPTEAEIRLLFPFFPAPVGSGSRE